jgi:predicted nucleic acid-binding protein
MPVGHPLDDTSLVLDNDLFTHWRNKHPYVLREIAEYTNRLKEVPALTSVTLFEALWGVENAAVKREVTDEESTRYRGRIEQLSESCVVLPFDRTAAAIAAYSFARLSRSEQKKLWRDLFTTASALAHGHGVATRNRSDFELIANNLPSDFPLLRLAIWKP